MNFFKNIFKRKKKKDILLLNNYEEKKVFDEYYKNLKMRVKKQMENKVN